MCIFNAAQYSQIPYAKYVATSNKKQMNFDLYSRINQSINIFCRISKNKTAY